MIRQSVHAAGATETGRTSRVSADQILLASFVAADQSAMLRVDKVLRERAVELLRAAPRDAMLAGRQCLAALASDCDCDSAALAVLDLDSHELRVAVQHGESVLLAESLDEPLLEAVTAALQTGRALEHPATDVQEALPAAAAALLAERGVQSLRWSLRRAGDAQVAIVALQATWRCRYWTPATRQLHEGTADLLVATPQLVAGGQPRSR